MIFVRTSQSHNKSQRSGKINLNKSLQTKLSHVEGNSSPSRFNKTFRIIYEEVLQIDEEIISKLWITLCRWLFVC